MGVGDDVTSVVVVVAVGVVVVIVALVVVSVAVVDSPGGRSSSDAGGWTLPMSMNWNIIKCLASAHHILSN